MKNINQLIIEQDEYLDTMRYLLKNNHAEWICYLCDDEAKPLKERTKENWEIIKRLERKCGIRTYMELIKCNGNV